MLNQILRRILSDKVLLVSALLAVVSGFFVSPGLYYLNYIDFRVLFLLLCLMIVVTGFQTAGLFAWMGSFLIRRAENSRIMTAVLVYLCFFSSMLVTNDVALIAFVPFTVFVLAKTHQNDILPHVIVLQTVAANLGSMLTPIGNPQNLFLFFISGFSLWKFVNIMLVYWLTSAGLLFILCMRVHPFLIKPVYMCCEELDTRRMMRYALLFGMCLLSVTHIIAWQITAITVLGYALIADKESFQKADYSLLLTFACFFIFSGNLGNIEPIRRLMEALLHEKVVMTSIGISQILSNVPAAVLLSEFTMEYEELLIGVNIGGLGTPIASLASIISLKMYLKTPNCNFKKYILRFFAINLIFLCFLSALYFMLTYFSF